MNLIAKSEHKAAAIFMTMSTFGMLQSMTPYFNEGRISITNITKAWERTSTIEDAQEELDYWSSEISENNPEVAAAWDHWKQNHVNIA